MYSYQDSDDRIPVLQMNSELEHAQLELLSAHCATYQLRLHYSADDLARFGRRDILRKSAQAASALSDFYSSIERKIPRPAVSPAASGSPNADGTNQSLTSSGLTSDAQIAQAVKCVSSYLRQQREHYFPAALPLDNQHKARMQPHFSATLLDQIRVVELKGKRVPQPPFYSEARAMGFDNLPEITHMDSLTFVDVVVFNEELTERSLFHALVHAVQFQILGVERYTELFVQSFLRTRTHFTVPLEAHAFSLTSMFQRPSPEKFCVDDHILRWITDDRY
jgi:hypothetical protein